MSIGVPTKHRERFKMKLHLVLKLKPIVGYGVLTLCNKIIFIEAEYTKDTVLQKEGPVICGECNRLRSLSKYKRLKKVFVAIEGEFPSDWVFPNRSSRDRDREEAERLGIRRFRSL